MGEVSTNLCCSDFLNLQCIVQYWSRREMRLDKILNNDNPHIRIIELKRERKEKRRHKVRKEREGKEGERGDCIKTQKIIIFHSQI